MIPPGLLKLKGKRVRQGTDTRLFYRSPPETVQMRPKCPKQYSVPDLSHPVKVVLQIVQCGEGGKQNLAGLEKVPEIGAGVGSAGVALAVGIHRRGIVAVTRLLDDHPAFGSKQAAIAGIAGGQI